MAVNIYNEVNERYLSVYTTGVGEFHLLPMADFAVGDRFITTDIAKEMVQEKFKRVYYRYPLACPMFSMLGNYLETYEEIIDDEHYQDSTITIRGQVGNGLQTTVS